MNWIKIEIDVRKFLLFIPCIILCCCQKMIFTVENKQNKAENPVYLMRSKNKTIVSNWVHSFICVWNQKATEKNQNKTHIDSNIESFFSPDVRCFQTYTTCPCSIYHLYTTFDTTQKFTHFHKKKNNRKLSLATSSHNGELNEL